MANDQNNSLLHWLSVDWIKNNSTLADNKGIPLVNRFICLLNAPVGPNDSGILSKNGWLELQVLSADVPNFSIEPVDQELNGAKRYYFKGRGDSDLGITFLETPDLLLRRFFYAWMQMAIDIEEGSGVRRNYMANYMPTPSEFVIVPLDFAGIPRFGDRFVNVFPYDVSGISYNYADAGEIIKTTVKFKYMYHHMTEWTNSRAYHVSAKSVRDSGAPDMSSQWIGPIKN